MLMFASCNNNRGFRLPCCIEIKLKRWLTRTSTLRKKVSTLTATNAKINAPSLIAALGKVNNLSSNFSCEIVITTANQHFLQE